MCRRHVARTLTELFVDACLIASCRYVSLLCTAYLTHAALRWHKLVIHHGAVVLHLWRRDLVDAYVPIDAKHAMSKEKEDEVCAKIGQVTREGGRTSESASHVSVCAFLPRLS